MTVFAAIRSKRQSATVLSLAILLWLGLLATACAAAVALDGLPSDVASSIAPHANHHGAMRDASGGHHHDPEQVAHLLGTDCCCELTAVFGAGPSESAKFVVLVALPPHTEPVLPVFVIQVMEDRQRPLPHETSPPVYLATQRLRI